MSTEQRSGQYGLGTIGIILEKLPICHPQRSITTPLPLYWRTLTGCFRNPAYSNQDGSLFGGVLESMHMCT